MEAAVVGGTVAGAVAGTVEGSGTSTLRLRPSDDPPQAAATSRSAESTRDRRLEITSETLFSLGLIGSSADEIGVANHRQAQEQGLQEQLFVHVQAEAAHCLVNVFDGGGELADAVGVVCM